MGIAWVVGLVCGLLAADLLLKAADRKLCGLIGRVFALGVLLARRNAADLQLLKDLLDALALDVHDQGWHPILRDRLRRAIPALRAGRRAALWEVVESDQE